MIPYFLPYRPPGRRLASVCSLRPPVPSIVSHPTLAQGSGFFFLSQQTWIELAAPTAMRSRRLGRAFGACLAVLRTLSSIAATGGMLAAIRSIYNGELAFVLCRTKYYSHGHAARKTTHGTNQTDLEPTGFQLNKTVESMYLVPRRWDYVRVARHGNPSARRTKSTYAHGRVPLREAAQKGSAKVIVSARSTGIKCLQETGIDV
ncbi:hypothetical protein J3F84DRAFT_356694 [Trichoderma pleuroticola]